MPRGLLEAIAAGTVCILAGYNLRGAVVAAVISLISLAAYRYKKRPMDERRVTYDAILRLVRERGTIANNDVERLLGVSDATAGRYLQKLETEGKLEQIGITGNAVHYKTKQ
jgi:predicted HTH transcriptional regulator